MMEMLQILKYIYRHDRVNFAEGLVISEEDMIAATGAADCWELEFASLPEGSRSIGVRISCRITKDWERA